MNDSKTVIVPARPGDPPKLRGRHQTAPERLLLVGLSPDEREAVRNLVHAIRAAKAATTDRDGTAVAS